MAKTILGISAYYHDSAAALIEDGEIIAAAQEERFTRIKHDSKYPRNAINFLLKKKNLKLNDVNYVVFYDKPFLKFERVLETYLAYVPRGLKQFRKAIPIWLRQKLFQKNMLLNEFRKHDKNFKDPNKLLFSEHHFSHAASAFYPSPFKDAIVLTLDGVGEWATTTIAIGSDKNLKIVKEIHFPHSIGLLYSAFTYYTGFIPNGGEYKLMGLAPYGEPKYKNLILENVVDIKNDGSLKLNMKYFDYTTGLSMVNENFCELFGQPVRKPDVDLLNQFHMDIAASIQSVIEMIVLKITRFISEEYKMKNLCMAGGVALNCVANGKILRDGHFDNIWIQPAAGDAGGAIGSALAAWHNELGNDRKINKIDGMKGSYLGPSFTDNEIEDELVKCGANFHKLSEEKILSLTAKELSNGKAVGWFQGNMEFGPRALGSRSIIADPRSETMQKNLNLKVKYRESFRPFAPSVLAEDVSNWFEINCSSPYMLFVANVKKEICREMTDDEKSLFGIKKLNIKRSEIPAVTHVDYSARIQTVHKETNPKFHKLISLFKKITGNPILLNTSFNIRDEPIVCTPQEAFKCFIGTQLDLLVCNNFLLYKSEQKEILNKQYKSEHKLD